MPFAVVSSVISATVLFETVLKLTGVGAQKGGVVLQNVIFRSNRCRSAIALELRRYF